MAFERLKRGLGIRSGESVRASTGTVFEIPVSQENPEIKTGRVISANSGGKRKREPWQVSGILKRDVHDATARFKRQQRRLRPYEIRAIVLTAVGAALGNAAYPILTAAGITLLPALGGIALAGAGVYLAYKGLKLLWRTWKIDDNHLVSNSEQIGKDLKD
ncbi:hypothetical protein HY090_00920 [Candidatus Kaiserbacteria bacterium]|nr:hypothetical protein [Candidatus Kaiserbacteria bacterium]